MLVLARLLPPYTPFSIITGIIIALAGYVLILLSPQVLSHHRCAKLSPNNFYW